MSKVKGLETYKKYWEDQASFMDKSPWNFRIRTQTSPKDLS